MKLFESEINAYRFMKMIDYNISYFASEFEIFDPWTAFVTPQDPLQGCDGHFTLQPEDLYCNLTQTIIL